MSKYDYLQKYVLRVLYEDSDKKVIGTGDNFFSQIKDKGMILKAEKRLLFPFPSELREFFLEIGWGKLRAPYDRPDDYRFHRENRILPPWDIVKIYFGEDETRPIDEDYALKDGEIPIFEVYTDEYSNLFRMRALSEEPNAVYDEFGNLVEKSFEKFIWKLYYEAPNYYDSDYIPRS